MRKFVRNLRSFYNRHFLRFEFLISIAITLLVYRLNILRYAPNDRQAIYVTLASSLGALLGFVITGVSVVLALSGSGRIDLLQKSPYFRQVFDVFVSTARMLGFGFLVAFAGLVLDRSQAPNRWIAYPMVFFVCACALRLFRCIWVLENLISIVSTEKDGRGKT